MNQGHKHTHTPVKVQELTSVFKVCDVLDEKQKKKNERWEKPMTDDYGGGGGSDALEGKCTLKLSDGH